MMSNLRLVQRLHEMNILAISTHRIRSVAYKINSTQFSTSSERSNDVAKLADSAEVLKTGIENEDMPEPEMCNPYVKEKPQCILCKHKVILDYKNPQLLSQFVSQFSGRVYGKHVTGLCSAQQKRLESSVKLSQKIGLMPYEYKDVKFINDPKLFDISNVGKKF